MKRNGGRRVWVLAALAVVVVAAAGSAGLYALPRLLGDLGDDAAALWGRPFLTLGTLQISAGFLIKSLIFFALLSAASRALRRLLRTRLLAHTALDEGQKFAFERAAGYVVVMIGLLVGLQSAGLNLESLTVFGGALGIGVGFGLQNVASNFISGLILLIERPIKVGDRIEVGELNGDVVRIAGRSTWIRTNDNIVIIVPNAEFVSSRVTNWTANDRRIRFAVPLGVSYSSRPEQVREILLEAAHTHPDVLDEPAPDVLFVGFGDSSLDFELRVWTLEHVRTPRILRSDLYFAIFAAFAKAEIEIPFPQRDIHVRSISMPIPLENAASTPTPLP